MDVIKAALDVLMDVGGGNSPSIFINEEKRQYDSEKDPLPSILSRITYQRTETVNPSEIKENVEVETKKSKSWYLGAGLALGALMGGAFAAADSASGGPYANQFNNQLDKGTDEVEMIVENAAGMVGNATEYVFDYETYKEKRRDADRDGVSDWHEKRLGTDPYKTPEQEEAERKIEELKKVDSDNDGLNDWAEFSVYGSDPYKKSTSKYDTFLLIGPDDFRERIADALGWYKETYPEGYEYADKFGDVITKRDTPGSDIGGKIYVYGTSINKAYDDRYRNHNYTDMIIYVENHPNSREAIACNRLAHLAAHNEGSVLAMKKGKRPIPGFWKGKTGEIRAFDKESDCDIGIGYLPKEKKIESMQNSLNSPHYDYNITKEEIGRIITSEEYRDYFEMD